MAAGAKGEEKAAGKDIAVLELVTFSAGEKRNTVLLQVSGSFRF